MVPKGPLTSFISYILRSVCIAACNLINNSMKQFIVSSETDEIREVEERVSGFFVFFFLFIGPDSEAVAI